MIDVVRTSDCVPVVRCRDCVFVAEDDLGNRTCIIWGSMLHPDGYCSEGRRDEDA